MLGLRWGLVALALLVAGIYWEMSRPPMTIVGNVTIDLVNGTPSLGGAVSYAAAVATAFGVRTCIVTAAAPDVDLSALAGHDVHIIPSNATLTFEHTYTFWGNHRRLRVLAQPNVTLSWEHVPPRCRHARTFLLGPLMPQDMDPASFLGHTVWGQRRHSVGLMAQGLQRALDASKKVIPLKKPSEQLMAALGPETTVFLSDVETDAWPESALASVADATGRLLVTRGAQGADDHRGPKDFARRPPHPVDVAVDTNGAGDCFATAYELARAFLNHPRPSAVANWAGGCAVSRQQDCKPDCIAETMQADWAAIDRLRDGPPDDNDGSQNDKATTAHQNFAAVARSALAAAAETTIMHKLAGTVERLWGQIARPGNATSDGLLGSD